MPVTASSTLTADLRQLVLRVEGDLRARVGVQAGVEDDWRAEHARAVEADRTAASYEEWASERITQAAVAWVLTTVFVRFCEDNGLLRPVWIAGPVQRRQEALDAQRAFITAAARRGEDVTDREWLLEAVEHLRRTPATAALVAPTNPLWQVAVSGDMASEILAFWRATDDDGRPVRNLADEAGAGGSGGTGVLDTRFLGDLYQDLSEAARERYALLQTPQFVEEYILDLTLTPALAERPLEGFRLIDPTCGSGHFLLGAFDRLLNAWHTHAPGMENRARVQKVLDSVVGVDLNPFAVAVARFRLLVTALRAGGDRALDDPGTPGYRLQLAAGDSLIHGRGTDELDLGAELAADRSLAGFGYATEDLTVLRDLLQEGTYDVVVGNPPYITVKDSALNAEYRRLYGYCKGTYALTVPFMERFFALARSGDRAGWVGQITSNSFMKREFGSKLIEEFLAKADVTHVVDTSGAYIPGHGTPTVIVVGRHRAPASATVRAVLGIRGEPGRPENPAKAIVWSAIVEHTDDAGYEDEWITVTDLDRRRLATHPWSLSGGGASELSELLDHAARSTLSSYVDAIGFGAVTREDSAFMVGRGTLRRSGVPDAMVTAIVEGDVTRDWSINDPIRSLWPYDAHSLSAVEHPSVTRLMWPLRRILRERVAYGQTQIERGLAWFEYSMFFAKRYRTPLSIAFAFVATHNHFVLDRGGKVFNRSAPVIKLPEGASEDDHLALLGVLNSSVACFWLKQNSHDKGSQSGTGGFMHDAWEVFYEFTGTTLHDHPLPASLPTDRARSLDTLAQHLRANSPDAAAARVAPTRAALDAARTEYTATRARMLAEQEELDWDVYPRYGLLDAPLTYTGGDLPPLELGERAFEVVLARRIAAGEETSTWFTRHGSTPVTDLPTHWPAAYRDLVQRRIDLIEADRNIRLLERPEHKRRWAWEGWEKAEERAVRTWLLDRLEDKSLWFDRQGRPRPRSLASLADDVGRDAEALAVLTVWEGREDVPVLTSLTRLLTPEAVPYLAAMRYKDPKGMEKRAAWEDVWDRQRAEDASTYDARPVSQGGRGPVPVPPKYTGADFRSQDIWSHRGKLDVPKERFIAYPGAHRSSDPTPVVGWAGWDHAQQALALATLYGSLREDGVDEDRLIPLLAGVLELLPWLRQWHGDPDPAYGGQSPADFIATWLDTERTALAVTDDQLSAWRPPAPTRGRRKKA